MRKYCSVAFLVALTGAGLASCAGSAAGRRGPVGPLPVAEAGAIRAVGLSEAQSNEALRLYTAKCVRCHKSYDPHAYTAPHWESWMVKMSHKAHLDAEQQDLIRRYLQAVRATPVPEKAGAATR